MSRATSPSGPGPLNSSSSAAHARSICPTHVPIRMECRQHGRLPWSPPIRPARNGVESCAWGRSSKNRSLEKESARPSHQGAARSCSLHHGKMKPLEVRRVGPPPKSDTHLEDTGRAETITSVPYPSLLILDSVTPASQFLLTPPGSILLPWTAVRRQRKSSSGQPPEAGFSRLGSVWPRNVSRRIWQTLLLYLTFF